MSGADSESETRIRVLRACDQCSLSKLRCDGKHPCHRCSVRKQPCQYEKPVRQRGRQRRTKLLNGHRTLAPSPGGLNLLNTDVPRSVDFTPRSTSNAVVKGFQFVYPNPPTPSSWTEDEIIARLTASTKLDGAGNKYGSENELHFTEPFHNLTGVHTSGAQGTDLPSLSNLFPLSEDWPDYVNAIASHESPCRIEHWLERTPPSIPPRRSLHDPHSTSAQKDTESSVPRRDSPGLQAYPGLEPLLPYLQGVLSASDAAEILDIYFNAQKNPRLKAMSPYILTEVLHPSRPRPTSSILLLVVLFCIAQTADVKIFDPPGARQRIIVDLYHLVLDLLEPVDVDNYFRTSDGWQFHPPGGFAKKDERAVVDYAANSGLIPDFLASTDVILALVILTQVISGGHFKADSLKWWAKVVRLVQFSGLDKEDQPKALRPGSISDEPSHHESSLRKRLIAKEERRRLFWLVYCLDRHLALSFNSTVHFPEGTFCVAVPLPESLWQSLPTVDLACVPTASLGPPAKITGYSFFEYFLPLATVLGHIIDFHHMQSHPLLGKSIAHASYDLDALISECREDLLDLKKQLDNPILNTLSVDQFSYAESQKQLVIAYSTHMLHVFSILLHGKWDPICMMDNEDDWISSPGFQTCASHALGAVTAVQEILQLDPELTFMPYLFSIYLFHGSIILLLFVDRMPELGFNKSVKDVCETIIRAHEVSVVTLDTTFQKTFRKVFRSMLDSAQRSDSHSSQRACRARQREMLSLYRWTRNSHGLAC